MRSTPKPLARLAVIGGSGLYHIDGLKIISKTHPKTPFGRPSDPIVIGELAGEQVAFLPRHGQGHRYLPSEIPQRANFYALKTLGVEFVLALSACGSLRGDCGPREFVVPDQIYDRTHGRPSTFFGDGVVAHIALAHPFSPVLRSAVLGALKDMGMSHHAEGTYLCMDGPAFSTKAESRAYQKLGCSVIGMTAMPEARLAREAELAYALVAMVTDYDSWKDEEHVTGDQVLAHMKANTANAHRLVASLLPKIKHLKNDCADALKGAIFTDPKRIPPAAKKKLGALIAKYV